MFICNQLKTLNFILCNHSEHPGLGFSRMCLLSLAHRCSLPSLPPPSPSCSSAVVAGWEVGNGSGCSGGLGESCSMTNKHSGWTRWKRFLFCHHLPPGPLLEMDGRNFCKVPVRSLATVSCEFLWFWCSQHM